MYELGSRMNIMKKLLLNPRFSFGVEDVNRSDMLEVNIGCGLKTYCVGWLALLAHYEVKLPGEYLNKISFFDTDFKRYTTQRFSLYRNTT